jgi:hypothetical protein
MRCERNVWMFGFITLAWVLTWDSCTKLCTCFSNLVSAHKACASSISDLRPVILTVLCHSYDNVMTEPMFYLLVVRGWNFSLSTYQYQTRSFPLGKNWLNQRCFHVISTQIVMTLNQHGKLIGFGHQRKGISPNFEPKSNDMVSC